MGTKITIPEPRRFFSYLDEKNFFGWLEDIPLLSSIVRVQDGLEITLDGIPDKEGIRDLIAVMRRYELDMLALRRLCTPENEVWMKDPKAYWYPYMFKDHD